MLNFRVVKVTITGI